MKVCYEWKKGKIVIFAAVSYMKSADLMGTAMRILDRGMRPSRDFKSQHFLAIKFVP